MKRYLLAIAAGLALAIPGTATAHITEAVPVCTSATLSATSWEEGGTFGYRVVVDGADYATGSIPVEPTEAGVVGPLTVDYPDLVGDHTVQVFTTVTTPIFTRGENLDGEATVSCPSTTPQPEQPVEPEQPATPAPPAAPVPPASPVPPTVITPPDDADVPPPPRVTTRVKRITCLPGQRWKQRPNLRHVRSMRAEDGWWYPFRDRLTFRNGTLISRVPGNFCGPFIPAVTGERR